MGGRTVLDLGAGSGLVSIAAAQAGAEQVIAAEIDPWGLAALKLNIAANDASVSIIPNDLLNGPPPPVDLVLVGDLFYEAGLAERVTAFLDRCIGAGVTVLIGDPWREFLPRRRLRLLAEYSVPDVGAAKGGGRVGGVVFSFESILP